MNEGWAKNNNYNGKTQEAQHDIETPKELYRIYNDL